MESFEDLFRDEVDYLQQLAEHLANDSPHLANFLPNSGDPDVARLVEGFSVLTANLRQKIEDDFPEITQNLLANVWPLPLRPIPSTSIIQFSPKNHCIDNATNVPKHSQLFAEYDDRSFTFQTCHDLHIEPLTLLHRELTHSAGSSQITLTFRYDGKGDHWQPTAPVRLFLGEDKALATTLILWLDCYLAKTAIHYEPHPIYNCEPDITAWQPDVSNLILPTDKPDFWPLQLLPELFYLPHVHDFISLDLCNERATLPFAAGQQFAITLVFDGVIPIDTIDNAFILNCVPAINLSRAQTPNVYFQKDRASYRLPLPGNVLFDIHSVVSHQEPESGLGEPHVFQPISAATLAKHRFSEQRQQTFLYEIKRQRDPLDREQLQLTFYQDNGVPMVECHLESFVCHYTAVDKQAEQIGRGMITLPSETIQSDLTMSNITPATPYYPMMAKTPWPLISLLQFNTVFLNDINALKDAVKQFDFYPERNVPLSRRIRHHIDGLIDISAKPIDRLRKGQPFRGIGISLTMDEHCYDSEGEMYQFAVALNTLFSVSQSESSFTCMNVIQLHSQLRWSFAPVTGQRSIM
ncbi:type VI secretion system baseplate subunit TssF [Serratia fonticola]|uniref:type VI secretion system baseplate subunit TssF n=1 Tax=Serratia fonticola TaxID=47917 RepID=UPI0003FC287F|nr:type VI secretion system baseplate subunit TssF [Serratia fonticola]